MKTREEILNDFSFQTEHGMKRYESDVLEAMDAYASQKINVCIEVIKNRISELEKEIISKDGFSHTWDIQRQKELQTTLNKIIEKIN